MLCKCRTNAGYRTRPAGTLDYSESRRAGPTCSVKTQWRRTTTRNSRRGVSLAKELAQTSETLPDVEQLLKRKTAVVLFAYLVLQIIRIGAQLLFRMEVRGKEVLDRVKPPYLICPEPSELRIHFLCVRRTAARTAKHFSGWRKHVLCKWLYVVAGAADKVIPIDPDATDARNASRAAGLRAGKILNIYPEGQRSFDGQLYEFRKGAAILATELDLPIVPVALDGASHLAAQIVVPPGKGKDTFWRTD